MELLRADNVVKRFDAVTAVDGVSFSVNQGEIFGFLGPNGAGKTTTINLLTGLARLTSGSLYLEGEEYSTRLKRAQAVMGVVPDESNLYEELDGFQNLTFCASLYGIDRRRREQRAKELLEQFGLAQVGKRFFKSYSRGMKRKLTIAAGIIHEPKILFLDEPTTGIDVMSARQIRTLILELNRRGTTIFLTTHYIEEAERLCHRIAFIVAGKIIRIGSLEELMQEYQRDTVLQMAVEETGPELLLSLRQQFPRYSIRRTDERSIRVVSGGSITLLPLLDFLTGRGVAVTEARLIRPTLEEVFVRVTGIESELMMQEREGKKK
ncbi:MAG: ABC transporter [Spirochaetes bacterium DG_61]|nr:MAG: ABC transporter [Spirochaetes bacterium DG_61]